MASVTRCPAPTTRRPAAMPHTRYSSTSSTSAGQRRPRGARRACPARACRARRPKPERAGADQRRALEQPARRHAGREPAHRRQLGEQVQVGDAGQAVGADRDRHARRVEPLERRRADADPLVAARAGHERRAARAQPRQARRRRAARRARPASARRARRRRSRYSTGPQTGRHPVVAPGADPSQQVAPRAACRDASNSISSGDSPRCTLVSGRRCRRPRRGSPGTARGDTEYGACGASRDADLRAAARGVARARPRPLDQRAGRSR